MALDPSSLPALAAEYAHRPPQDILALAVEHYSPDVAISFSGAEDVVLIDMVSKLGARMQVFSLDTGRLHPETYRFIDRVAHRYGIDIQVMFPRPEAVQQLVSTKGLFSFYKDGHKECCGIRKVEPLKRALAGYRAWMTGQRRDQSPTRADVAIVELDASHTGRSGPLVKWNPLAEWSLQQVWSYIRENQLPYNPLHDRGFISIGCEPCTRAVRPGEHERAGRWWWEEATQRECGLHVKD